MRVDRSRERGIALLLVVWVFMTLGVLALDFSHYVRDDAMAAVNFADETRGYYLALAGMNRALFDAMQERERAKVPVPAPTPGDMRSQGREADEEEQPIPADGQWHDGTFAGGTYKVRMTDEGGRLSLNHADEILLTRVVTALVRGGNATTGVDRRVETQIETIVDSILDWRDTDNMKRLHGAENDYYLSRRHPYRAKNGYFDSPEELLRVRGVTPALYYGAPGQPGLRDVVSVFNKSTTLNVHYMPATVIQALLGLDPDAAAQMAADRDADPAAFLPRLQAEATAVDPHLAPLLIDEAPHTVLLEGRADAKTERNQSAVAAVVELAADDIEGPKILRWLDRAPWTGALPAAPPREARL